MNTRRPNLQQEINEAVAAEFTLRQADLVQGVKETVASALKDDQRVVVIADQTKEKRSRWWDFMQIMFPALLTSLFGFVILYTQHNLSTELTTSSTRYVLTQEYDKEKFKVYQRTMERLTTLGDALAGAKYGSEARSKAVSAYNALND